MSELIVKQLSVNEQIEKMTLKEIADRAKSGEMTVAEIRSFLRMIVEISRLFDFTVNEDPV